MDEPPNPVSNIFISSSRIDPSTTGRRVQSQYQLQYEHQHRRRRRLSELPPISPLPPPPPSASPSDPPRPAHPEGPLDLDSSFQKFLNSYQTHTHNLKETHTHWLSLRTHYILQVSHPKHTRPNLSFGRWITQTYHELTRDMIISMIKYEFEAEYTNDVGKRVKAEIRKLSKRFRVTVWDLCFALGRDVLLSIRALVVLNGLCREINGKEDNLQLRLEGLIPKLEEQVWKRYLARDQHASADMTRFAPADVIKACAALKADNILLKDGGKDKDGQGCGKEKNEESREGYEEIEEGIIGVNGRMSVQKSGQTTILQNGNGAKDSDFERVSESESNQTTVQQNGNDAKNGSCDRESGNKGERNNDLHEKEYDYDEGYGYDGPDTSTDGDESMDIIENDDDTINEFNKAFGSHIQDHRSFNVNPNSLTPVPTCRPDQTNTEDGSENLLDSITSPNSSDVTPIRNKITTRNKKKRTNSSVPKMINSVDSQYIQEPETPEIPRHAIADRQYESDNEGVIDGPFKTSVDLAYSYDESTFHISPPRFQDPPISDRVHKNAWGRPEDLIFYSNTHTNHTSVVIRFDEEIPRLQPGQWLNDELINLHLLWMYQNTTHSNVSIFDTFLYPRLIKDNKLIRNRPLSRMWFQTTEWIIIPVCEASHWYVVIVGNFSMLRPSAQSDPKAPFLIILDSLDSEEVQYSAARKKLADFIKGEAEIEWGSTSKKFEFPHVKRSLRQSNATDCGLYLLEHVDRFLNCPMGFLKEVLGDDENVNEDEGIRLEMRIPFDPLEKRNDLMDLILRLKKDQDRSRGLEERKRDDKAIRGGNVQKGDVQSENVQSENIRREDVRRGNAQTRCNEMEEDIESLHHSQASDQPTGAFQSLHPNQASKQANFSALTHETKIYQPAIKSTDSAIVLASSSTSGPGSTSSKETPLSDSISTSARTGNEYSAPANVNNIVENTQSSTVCLHAFSSLTPDIIISKLQEQCSILQHHLKLVQFSGRIFASMRPAFTEQDIWNDMPIQSSSSSTPPISLNPNISLREYRKRKREEEVRTIEPFCSLVLEKENRFNREYEASLKLLEALEGWERDITAVEVVTRESIRQVKERIEQLEGFCQRIYKEVVFREMFKDQYQWEADMEKQRKVLECEVDGLEKEIEGFNGLSGRVNGWVENARVLVRLVWKDLMKVEEVKEEIQGLRDEG